MSSFHALIRFCNKKQNRETEGSWVGLHRRLPQAHTGLSDSTKLIIQNFLAFVKGKIAEKQKIFSVSCKNKREKVQSAALLSEEDGSIR